MGVATVADGVITFPANASQCRVSGVSTINGVDTTDFPVDGTPLTIFVSDASPTNAVILTHKATLESPNVPFYLPPLAGETTGESISIEIPSTISCWLDLTDNCVRLTCEPYGSAS